MPVAWDPVRQLGCPGYLRKLVAATAHDIRDLPRAAVLSENKIPFGASFRADLEFGLVTVCSTCKIRIWRQILCTERNTP